MAFDNLSDNPLNYITYLNINGVIQDGVSTNRQYLNTYSDSGIITFSGLSMSGTNTINVGACKAWIVDNETDALLPTKTYVEYSGQSGVPVTTMTGTNEDSYVILTSIPSIEFLPSFPISSERKSGVLLGRVNHPNNVISLVVDKPDFNISPNSQVRDIFKVLSLINAGMHIKANGSNLNLTLNGGILYGYGINYVNDKTNPNALPISSASTANFSYVSQTGGTSGIITSIDPDNYDVDGVITPISGPITNATIQYIYYVPNYGLGIQRGQTVYDSIDDAVYAMGKENSFNVNTSLDVNGILIGMLALRKNATTLNDLSQAVFVRTDKFGQPIGVSGGQINRTDYFTTGFTFNQSNYDLTVSLNNGSAYTQNLSILASEISITGGSYNPNTGSIIFTNSTGGTFTVSGFTSGMTDTYITGSTFVDNNLTITNNTGGTITTLIDNFSGLTISGVTFNKLLLEKVGTISGSSFIGNPKTYDVTFASNFPNTNYAITLGGEDERLWFSSNKSISGFTINAGANTPFSGLVYYIAKESGEV